MEKVSTNRIILEAVVAKVQPYIIGLRAQVSYILYCRLASQLYANRSRTYKMALQLGNCKRQRREAAIAKSKKPLTPKGSGERRKLPSEIWNSSRETDAILNISCQN